MEHTTERPRPWRRVFRLLAGLLAAAVLTALALPWALSSRSGREWLLGRAGRAMAPGGFGLDSIAFSWFGPTRMTGFVLRDARGDRVVAATRATWDRNLGQILFLRPKLGTLRLEHPAIDVERASDGTIDLVETLRPVLGLDPNTSLVIEIRDGTLRVRGAGFEQPVVAEHAEIRVAIAARPKRVTWSAHLANGDLASPRNSLDVTGNLERATTPGNLALRVTGRSWPLAIGGSRLSASGHFDGRLSAKRAGGRWKLAGDVAVAEAEAAGSRLAGDRLRLDRVTAAWEIDETTAGWSVRRLDVNSPIAKLEASGSVVAADPLGGSSRVDGTIDLVALAAQLPHALRLREGVALDRGTAAVRVATLNAGGTPALDVSARVSDLVASDHGRTFTLHEPATLSARLKQTGGVVVIDWLSAETPYMNIKAQGELKRGVALTGTIDLSGLKRQFGDLDRFREGGALGPRRDQGIVSGRRRPISSGSRELRSRADR